MTDYHLAISYQYLAAVSAKKARNNFALASTDTPHAARHLEFAVFWQRLAAADHRKSVEYMSE